MDRGRPSKRQIDERILAQARERHLGMTDVATGLPLDQVEAEKQLNPWAPYRNKTEWLFAQYLEGLVRLGQVAEWEYEPFSFDLVAKSIIPARTRPDGHTIYTPDWRIRWADGREWIAETKGHWRQHDRKAWRTAAMQHPGLAFVEINRRGGKWVQTPFKRKGRQ